MLNVRECKLPICYKIVNSINIVILKKPPTFHFGKQEAFISSLNILPVAEPYTDIKRFHIKASFKNSFWAVRTVEPYWA